MKFTLYIVYNLLTPSNSMKFHENGKQQEQISWNFTKFDPTCKRDVITCSILVEAPSISWKTKFTKFHENLTKCLEAPPNFMKFREFLCQKDYQRYEISWNSRKLSTSGLKIDERSLACLDGCKNHTREIPWNFVKFTV